MNLTALSKIKVMEKQYAPEKPFRIGIRLAHGNMNEVNTFNDPWNDLYAENKTARDARIMERVNRGLCNLAEARRLCNEPIPNGFWEIPKTDFPLVEV